MLSPSTVWIKPDTFKAMDKLQTSTVPNSSYFAEANAVYKVKK
jgi:hypothetical protein